MGRARRFRPDLIELRLDYIRDLDIEKLEELGGSLFGNEILTIRSLAEGGYPELSEAERIRLVLYVISNLEPRYVDVEIFTLRKHATVFQNAMKQSGTKLIASYHDLSGEKSATALRNIANSTPMNAESLYAVKVVTSARSLGDNLKALSLYSSPKRGRPLVSFCMGELGVPSRILCLYLGSPYSYASLPGEAVASGQLDIRTMKRIVGGW